MTAGMNVALEVASTTKGRAIAVLGSMFELGDDEERLHREVGALARQLGIHCVLSFGALAVHIAEGAEGMRERTMLAESVATSDDAAVDLVIDKLGEIAQAGDVVLVKGSRGVAMERIVQALCDVQNER